MLANKKSLLAVSIAASFALTGCFSDNDNNVVVEPPTETPTEIVVPDTIVTEQPSKVFSVNVVNRANSDVLEGATVSFLVDGEAATNLTDVNNEDLSMVTVDETGNFTFLSKEGASGDVTAVVSAEGYISKSFVVDLSAELDDGANDIPLEFSLVAADATGVTVKTEKAAVTGGSTAEAVTASASEGTAGSSVTVSANTEFQNAAGEAISGEEVTMNVVAADSSNVNAGAIIPEGLNAGATTEVMTSLGVTSITMSDETGAHVKKFSQPISVSVNLPADSDVAAGDMLSIASYDEVTGMWAKETVEATVGTANTDGTYPASFETDHLTFFAIGNNVPVCTAGLTLNVTGDIPARGLAVSISSSDGTIGSYTRSATKHVIPASSASRFGIAQNATAHVRLYDYSGNNWYTSDGEVPICGNVNVNIGSDVETFDKNVTLVGTCAADSTVTANLSGSIVTYAKDGKAAALAESMGESTFKLEGVEVGANYKVRATIRGAKVDGGGQSKVFTFENVQNDGNALTGDVAIECNEVPVTGTN
ncbi:MULTISPECIES: hypothetical protein [Pseudoalteromonas]|uniref:Big-1 domain-containing protein n=1 Tax=Pseudoalteromonas amylolytica TaxID=1859457 RepID=A0A1S1N283_9GAMM|nr:MULTISPECIES: hypothetical protein [Pseudoalteromonas]OHU90665.1 hypothetical protein BFC16_03415 [Pseudoalteromonas sp. JW3]OHU92714.1 hypothetical protein BET10_04475 [Pseudoalteromonas amylolytica]